MYHKRSWSVSSLAIAKLILCSILYAIIIYCFSYCEIIGCVKNICFRTADIFRLSNYWAFLFEFDPLDMSWVYTEFPKVFCRRYVNRFFLIFLVGREAYFMTVILSNFVIFCSIAFTISSWL